MGKKNLKKYKKKKNIDQEEYKEKIKSSTTDNKSQNILFKDKLSLLQKLTSEDFDTLNHITSILSSFEFDHIKDQSINNIISPEIISALVNLLNNEYYQIKYNAISSLTNILISFSDTDIDKNLILKTDFCKYCIEIIKDFTKVEKGSKEFIKRVRTLKNLLDLCMLILDMTDSDNLINNNFFNIIFQFLYLINNNTDLINEDLLEHINQFLGSVFSTIVIQIKNFNNNKEYYDVFKIYIEKMNNLFNSKETANENKSSIGFILFYINLINYDFLKQNNINLLPGLIDYSFNELTKDDILKNLNLFSELISAIEKEKKLNDIEMNKNEENNDDIKSKAKLVSEEINSLLNNLKIFQEIITTVEGPSSNTNNKNENNINMDEYEEIEDENIDNDTNMKNSDLFDDIINKVLNEILSVNNYEPLKKMINQKVMNNLSLLCNVQNKLYEYYINDNDKILQIKENLGEIEYMSLSIINNIIIKYSTYLNNEYINSLYSFLGQKMNQLITNIKENEYILSLIILTMRTLLDKYNGNFKNFSENDFLNLFNIIQNVNDTFIKCNVIDIIALCSCVDNNFRIGENLKKLLFSENDIEVLSHVINAFMDIYKNDDLESNKYLKQIGVMDLFNKAVPEFKNKFKNAKKEGKMEQESIDYCKDTFLNMKRFIKYKIDNFKQLKI